MKAQASCEVLDRNPALSYDDSDMAKARKKAALRGERMVIMLTPTEKELLQAAADRRNLQLSSWVRFILLAEAKSTVGG